MIAVILILVGILVASLLTYLVVNKIPRKRHWMLSIILLGGIVFLTYKISESIMKPIRFNKEKRVKYQEVINHMKLIRDAQVAHRKVTGKYVNKVESLIAFVDTAKFALTQTRNVVKTINVGGGITKEIEEKVVDTIGFDPVSLQFKGTNYKQMHKIPGTKEYFKIAIDEIEKIPGVTAKVFEVSVDKGLILEGMDVNLVKQEKEAIGGEEIAGELIRVGSLVEVSEEGNWPPFYDKRNQEDNE